jgi:hypothetical protein
MVLILVYTLYDQLSHEAKQFDIKQGQRKAWRILIPSPKN